MRKILIAGNWKMHKSIQEALTLVASIKAGLHKVSDADVVICPPFTALHDVSVALKGTRLELGAQDMHHETEGAYTGEISPLMLKDMGCRYVILGHSERRAYFHESSEFVNRKTRTAVKYNMIPIVCVGESLDQREAGQAEQVVRTQFRETFAGLSREAIEKVLIAYEPVWAIGTGRTATPEQAQEMHAYVRELVREVFGEEVAHGIRIVYGGSVRPDNAAELTRQPDVDGALVGGASLKAESFVQIVVESLNAEVKGSPAGAAKSLLLRSAPPPPARGFKPRSDITPAPPASPGEPPRSTTARKGSGAC